MSDINPSANGNQPTPASRILALMTSVVTLPRLSHLAGEDVRVRVRMAAAEEVLAATEIEETWGMDQKEVAEYMEQLPPEQRRRINMQADEQLEQFLRAVVTDPGIGEQEGQIPYTAIRSDRYALLQSVLDLSGFGAPFRVPPAATAPAPGSDGAPVGAAPDGAAPAAA